MKISSLQFIGIFLALLCLDASATVRYVNLNNASPASPYTSWATAATNIQAAIDVAANGDQILVTNGIYQTGGRLVSGSALSNRVAVTKPVTVQSVNGPAVTVIKGFQVPAITNGLAAIRCVYLTNGAVLSGFTLTNGATRTSGGAGEVFGGGIWCPSVSGVVSNCLITGNAANSRGGGVYQGFLQNCTLAQNVSPEGGGAAVSTLTNCLLTGNWAGQGGAAYTCVLANCIVTSNSAGISGGAIFQGSARNCAITENSSVTGGGTANSALTNCTVTGNFADTGGGISGGSLFNCIVYFNTAENNPDATSYFPANYCCLSVAPPSGAGNILVDPQLASAWHLSAASPCRGAGSADYITGVDIDGEVWADPPSIGCDELDVGAALGDPVVGIRTDSTNLVVGFSPDFTADIAGRVTASRWEFGDGTVVSNQPYISHSWTAPGDYPVVLRAYNTSYPNGLSATVAVHVVSQSVQYVALGNPTPLAPYTSWATAATNIQSAVDAATTFGGLVLVSNGVYRTGGTVVYGTMTNRVAVTKPLIVQSVNGPAVTFIEGRRAPGTTNGNSAVRCVYLGKGAALAGFTLTNGATRAAGDSFHEESAGGIWCESVAVVISNCVLTGNSAAGNGGGAYSGTLTDCVLTDNIAGSGGGAYASTLVRCTLTGNFAGSGGGTRYGRLTNCLLTGNSAFTGGGAGNGTLNNCAIIGNSADDNGGGVASSTLNNCTLTGNSALTGGGAVYGTLNNSLIYYNSAEQGPNHSGGTLNYCCTTPLPIEGGHNFLAEPKLADAFHLSDDSPCLNTGSAAFAAGTDMDGESWASPPSIGCDEYYAGAIGGLLGVDVRANYTNVATGFSVDFVGVFAGHARVSFWDFGDGTIVSNRPNVSHAWTVSGDYSVVLRAVNDSYPAGVSATVLVHVLVQPVYYVAVSNTAPAAPYTSWATAAKTIQDAVDAASSVPGTLVLVSNGIYEVGGKVIRGLLMNRVAVTKPLILKSVNGPASTIIRGYQLPSISNGNGAIRCVYLTNEAVLSGFTLTNGATRTNGTSIDTYGGGLRCEPLNAIVTNCVLVNNTASYNGGGACYGTLINCTLSGNSVDTSTGGGGGGAIYSTLIQCALTSNSASGGGATYGGALINCTLTGNSASYQGGAIYDSIAFNCQLTSNSAAYYGGGAWSGTLVNCTLNRNSVLLNGGGAYSGTLVNCTVADNSVTGGVSSGGGTAYSTLRNCIVYFNNAPSDANNYSSYLYHCCTTPQPSNGSDNITNAPLFMDYQSGNLRLQAGSPCINAGNNDSVASNTDLDSLPRIVGGTVDVGAYEFQSPGSILSYAWAQQFGLPTDGSADFTDNDSDGLNNWQEWIAGTIPTNSLSVLKIFSPSNNAPGLKISWQSVTNKTYFLQRSTNLLSLPVFSMLQSDIVGQINTTTYTDNTATNRGPYFYRVGVQ